MTLQINPTQAALVLLDYQNHNVHPDGYWARAIVLADCCESVTDEMHEFSITQILPAMADVVVAADFIEWARAG